uniref:hypothetical protein n=1 Tax=Staphylococcus aureus TaxID=1280 RepID=UPI00210E4EB4
GIAIVARSYDIATEIMETCIAINMAITSPPSTLILPVGDATQVLRSSTPLKIKTTKTIPLFGPFSF